MTSSFRPAGRSIAALRCAPTAFSYCSPATPSVGAPQPQPPEEEAEGDDGGGGGFAADEVAPLLLLAVVPPPCAPPQHTSSVGVERN